MKYISIFFTGAIIVVLIHDGMLGAIIGGVSALIVYKLFSYLMGKWVDK